MSQHVGVEARTVTPDTSTTHYESDDLNSVFFYLCLFDRDRADDKNDNNVN